MHAILEKTISLLTLFFYYGYQSIKALEYYSISFLNALTILNNQAKDEIQNELNSYPYKYEKEFDELQEQDIEPAMLDSFKTNFIKDTTPGGEIVMAYDAKEETYIYFSESSHVQFRFLDTVAMKFVIIHNAKKIYQYLRDEMKDLEDKKNDNLIEMIDETEGNSSPQEKSIKEKRKELFVQFKKYSKNTETKKFIKENLNKFKRMGNLLDYERHLEFLDNLEKEKPKMKLSYRAFKTSINDPQ